MIAFSSRFLANLIRPKRLHPCRIRRCWLYLGTPEFTISEPGTTGRFFAADIGAAIDIGRSNLSFSYDIKQQANGANVI